MTYLLGQMLLCLIIAFLLGLFLGWLWQSLKQARQEEQDSSEQDTVNWQAKYVSIKEEHQELTDQLEEAQKALSVCRADLEHHQTTGDWQAPYEVAIDMASRLQDELTDTQTKLRTANQTIEAAKTAPGEAKPLQPDWTQPYQVAINMAQRLQTQLQEKSTQMKKLALEKIDTPPPSPKQDSPPSSGIDWAVSYQIAIDKASKLQSTLSEKEQTLLILLAEQEDDGRPTNLFKTAPDVRDPLEEISGVGPVLHKMLNDLGIYQFQQIANFRPQDVTWVSENLTAFKNRITRDDWVSQAKVLHAKHYGEQP